MEPGEKLIARLGMRGEEEARLQAVVRGQFSNTLMEKNPGWIGSSW